MWVDLDPGIGNGFLAILDFELGFAFCCLLHVWEIGMVFVDVEIGDVDCDLQS